VWCVPHVGGYTNAKFNLPRCVQDTDIMRESHEMSLSQVMDPKKPSALFAFFNTVYFFSRANAWLILDWYLLSQLASTTPPRFQQSARIGLGHFYKIPAFCECPNGLGLERWWGPDITHGHLQHHHQGLQTLCEWNGLTLQTEAGAIPFTKCCKR
jgi:hypothetical protein